MKPTPAPCLGCTSTCPRRGNRRVSKELRERCRRDGGNLVATSNTAQLPILQPSSTSGVDKTHPCEHRSKESVGTATCGSCSGKVSLKVFKCDSPETPNSLCVIGPKKPNGEYSVCSGCKVQTVPGSVLRDRIVVGVTTAPRATSRLSETLSSLRSSGFDHITVFADGYRQEDFEALGDALDGCELIERPYPVGGWPNFYLSLAELYHRFPTAGLYAMFQDDVQASPGLADYLLRTVDQSFPVWSPFATEVNQLKKQGWNKVDAKFSYCGAQAFVFTNEWVRVFLADPQVVNYRRFPDAVGKHVRNDGLTHIDGVVGRWAHRHKKGVATHHPSLIEHTGDTSVMHPGANYKNQWRSAKYFLGDYPLDGKPHVACMMVCGGSEERKRFVRPAIEDFLAQDYEGDATLVIFDDHEESILYTDSLVERLLHTPCPENRSVIYFPTPSRSIGAQRQALLEHVSSKPEFHLLLQWDDDDRYSRDYLSYRVATCPPGAATILTRETFFFEDGSPDARIDFGKHKQGFPGFPGTIMFPSCFAKSVRYPDQQRHEDTEFMRALAKVTTLIPLKNDFDKYFRRVHPTSASGLPHFENLVRKLETPDA